MARFAYFECYQQNRYGISLASTELQKHGSGVDYLLLTVVNPVPEVPVPSQGSRLALTNLTERLRIAYDGRASLHGERKDDHFRIEMRLPVVTEVRQGVA